jgi:murein DD-endopeptidase MepM/ murein hydrolase activator NlpD
MTRSRTFFALLVATLVAALAAPAAAASNPEAQRAQVRSKRAQLAAQLNTLTASEAQLLSAARLLSAQASAQARTVAAARQAAAAADAEFADANRQLDETRANLAKLTRQVVDQAVAQYISPRSTVPAIGGDTSDLAAKARRAALLSSINANTADTIDRLNAAREDFDAKAKAAKALREKAMARKSQSEAALTALRQAEADKERLTAGVTARRQAVLREIDAQAKADAQLTAIINQRSRSGPAGADSTARSGQCIWPANGTVTSEYGRRWGRLHAGIDIANRTGTPIWAAKAGTVIFVGSESGYGNTVIIDHGGSFSTLYAHMSRFGTSEGASVGQGQLIGYIGTTGDATGAHVHFETRYGGTPRNPRGCLT